MRSLDAEYYDADTYTRLLFHEPEDARRRPARGAILHCAGLRWSFGTEPLLQNY